MLKVGQIETVEITGYTSEGLGVCRIDGCAVFVPNAIRGEVCEVAVSYVSRNSAQAKITRLITASPHRINRLCPDGKRCGGCQLHHMDYAEELLFKARKVTDALNRIGGQDLALVPITGGDGKIHCFAEKEAAGQPNPLPPQPYADVPAAHAGTSLDYPLRSETNPAIHLCAPQPDDSAAGSPPPPIPTVCLSYRNKAQYPVQKQNGMAAAGFYRQRTHEVIPIERCAILPPEFDAAKEAVLRWANENHVPAYDEATGTGLLRHIYVRKGFATGQLMVCIVAAGSRLPRPDRLISALRQSHPGLQSVILAVNKKPGNAILGDEFHTLFGTDEIEDVLCGFRFRLSPRSFYQVNPAQAQRLYEKAVALADLKPDETVLDLYCGTGTITLALSRRAGRAIGVEIIPQAIADAKENARRNGVENAEFYCADAAEAARRFAKALAVHVPESSFDPALQRPADPAPQSPTGCAPQSLPLGGKVSPQATDEGTPRTTDEKRTNGSPTGIDVIVVDPPRKGLSPDVIEAMVTMSPERIVYVSCDPATLARDVKLLSEKGYTLQSAEAVDMFPRTFHVETVCLLSKLRTEQKVEIDLDLSELDLTSAESAATYQEIKDYVQETFGFQVTSLQIAQTKRSLGLPVGVNYNPSKKETHHIPQCPPEKAAAIRTALEHFQML